jgi:hypothetical protein
MFRAEVTMPSPEDHVRTLQAQIRERLDALRPLVPDSDGYVNAAAKVLEATAELIEYEQRLPFLIDEPRHRLSVTVVRWSGIATAAVAGLLALATIPGWISWWWLALLLPVLLAGLRMLWLPVHPAGGPHEQQRVGAAVVGASSPVTALVVTGAVPPWAAAATVVMLAAGLGYVVRETVPPPSDDDEPAGPADTAGDGGEGGGDDGDGDGRQDQRTDPDAPTPPTGLVMPP